MHIFKKDEEYSAVKDMQKAFEKSLSKSLED